MYEDDVIQQNHTHISVGIQIQIYGHRYRYWLCVMNPNSDETVIEYQRIYIDRGNHKSFCYQGHRLVLFHKHSETNWKKQNHFLTSVTD